MSLKARCFYNQQLRVPSSPREAGRQPTTLAFNHAPRPSLLCPANADAPSSSPPRTPKNENIKKMKPTKKAFDSNRQLTRSGDTLGHHVAHLLGFFAKPFVVRPPPYTRLPARSAASVENLFGPPGGGGGVVRRKRGSTGGRVGSSSSNGGSGRLAAEGAGSNEICTGGDPTSLFAPPSCSSEEEIPPVRLLRTTRQR